MTEAPDIVIGSGPAGVSAAKALLARGRNVVMLDGGKLLEPAAEARRDTLATSDPTAWTQSDRDDWMAPQYATPEGQVRRFGSDFAMEPAAATLSDPPDWFALRASKASGGLSNLWGAAVLPYGQTDLRDWPISTDDLAPHYKAVGEFVPVAGQTDDLQELLPAFSMSGREPIPPAPQAEVLLARLQDQRQMLAGLGVTAGMARQAVGNACRQCGLCLHGCPYGLIWSAKHTLNQLRTDPRFRHVPSRNAVGIAETSDKITVHVEGGGTFSGGRVFLAAGVLESARILLASAPGLSELELLDSQHAFLPMLHRWGNKRRPDEGAFHTLPQVFVEISSADVSPHLVHSQLYTWNEHYERDLVSNYGSKLPFAKGVFATLARRLIVAQLFLHSDHSHRIGLSRATDGRLNARLIENPDLNRRLKAATGRMATAMGKAGLTALTFASRPGAPGSSFHVGGTIPMSDSPGKTTSDVIGRPNGFSRLHVVDASVLPAIPATTITFSVMANAHRIATLAP